MLFCIIPYIYTKTIYTLEGYAATKHNLSFGAILIGTQNYLSGGVGGLKQPYVQLVMVAL